MDFQPQSFGFVLRNGQQFRTDRHGVFTKHAGQNIGENALTVGALALHEKQSLFIDAPGQRVAGEPLNESNFLSTSEYVRQEDKETGTASLRIVGNSDAFANPMIRRRGDPVTRPKIDRTAFDPQQVGIGIERRRIGHIHSLLGPRHFYDCVYALGRAMHSHCLAMCSLVGIGGIGGKLLSSLLQDSVRNLFCGSDMFPSIALAPNALDILPPKPAGPIEN